MLRMVDVKIVMEGVMELNEFLKWLIGPGAGVAAYFFIKNLDWKVTWEGCMYRLTFKTLEPKILRRWGIVLPGAVAAVAYSIAVAMGYTVAPSSAQAWGEALFMVAASAVTAQLMHGEKEL